MNDAFDVRAAADWLRDSWKQHSSCPTCGSREPARLWADGCSDCESEMDRAWRAEKEGARDG